MPIAYYTAPAQDVLEYQTYTFDSGFGKGTTIYQGAPSDEVDQAWEDLYSCKSG